MSHDAVVVVALENGHPELLAEYRVGRVLGQVEGVEAALMGKVPGVGDRQAVGVVDTLYGEAVVLEAVR